MALWYSRNIQNQQDVAINDLSSNGVEYNGEVPDVEIENNVVVPECTIVMSDEQCTTNIFFDLRLQRH